MEVIHSGLAFRHFPNVRDDYLVEFESVINLGELLHEKAFIFLEVVFDVVVFTLELFQEGIEEVGAFPLSLNSHFLVFVHLFQLPFAPLCFPCNGLWILLLVFVDSLNQFPGIYDEVGKASGPFFTNDV